MPVAQILCLKPENFNTDPNVVKAIHKLTSPNIRGEKMNNDIFNIRVNKSDRVLFTIEENKEGITFILLELVKNHDYQKASFLKSPSVLTHFLEKKRPYLVPFESEGAPIVDVDVVMNRNMLDAGDEPRFIQWDAAQQQGIYTSQTTLVTGIAGTGKTAIHFARMQEILSHMDAAELRPIVYVAEPVRLVRHMRLLWSELCSDFAEDPRVLFFTVDELLAHFNVIAHKMKADKDFFLSWCATLKSVDATPQDIYEEFRLISIYAHRGNMLSVDDYLHCGDKHSLFPITQRQTFFDLYNAYQRYLEMHHRYDPGFLDTLPTQAFFRVFVDEAMLLTLGHWYSLEQLAIEHGNCFTTDSLQAVLDRRSHRGLYIHLYRQLFQHDMAIVQLSAHYRSPPKVIEFLTDVITLRKTILKGFCCDPFEPTSIESTMSICAHEQHVQWIKPKTVEAQQLIAEISAGVSVRAASTLVIVLREEDKLTAHNLFHTASICTIEESVGLSFPCVILFEIFNQPEIKKIGQLLNNHASISNREREQLRRPLNAIFVAASRSSGTLFLYGEMKHHLQKVQQQFTQYATTFSTSALATDENWLKTIGVFIKNGNDRQAQEMFQTHFPTKDYDAFKESIMPSLPSLIKQDVSSSPITVQQLTKAFPKYVKPWLQQDTWLNDLETMQTFPLSGFKKEKWRGSLLRWIIDSPDTYSDFIKTLFEESNQAVFQRLLTSFREEHTGNTALHLALQAGREDFISLLLVNTKTVLVKNNQDQTVLDIALFLKSIMFLHQILLTGLAYDEYHIDNNRLMIKKKSAMSQPEYDMTRPPLFLCHSFLLQDDDEVCARIKTMPKKAKYIMFLIATQQGLYETVSELLHQGVDPFRQTSTGLSAAYLAIQYGHSDVVELFLSLDTHPIIPPPGGWCPFKWTMHYAHAYIFDMLLNARGGLDQLCPKLRLLTDDALEPISQLLHQYTLPEHVAMQTALRELLTFYPYFLRYHRGERSVALKNNIMKILSSDNKVFFYVMSSSLFEVSPLITTITATNVNVLREIDMCYVLDNYIINTYQTQDADIIRTSQKKEHLFKTRELIRVCIERNHQELLSHCFRYQIFGSNVTYNMYYQTLLLSLRHNPDRSMMEFYTKLMQTTYPMDYDHFTDTLHASFWIRGDNGATYKTTLLHLMIEHAKTPSVYYTLIKYLTPSHEDHCVYYQDSRYGRTPLMMAAALKLPFLVSILLKKMKFTHIVNKTVKANVFDDKLFLVDHAGHHVLGVAIAHGCIDSARALLTAFPILARKTMYCIEDPGGMTPLMLAAYYGHGELVRALLALRIDPYGCNVEGKTAIRFAVIQNHPEVVEIFKEHDGALMPWFTPSFFRPRYFSARDIEGHATLSSAHTT